MITFRFKNIKAFKEATMVMPETGCVVIAGDNSNGKSILPDILTALCTGLLRDRTYRDIEIIHDEANEASFEIIHEGVGHKLQIDLVRDMGPDYQKLTIASLANPNQKKTLTMREGKWKLALEFFGFVTIDDEIIMQVKGLNEPQIGTATTAKQLYSILEKIKTDRFAQDFIDNYENITAPLLNEQRKVLTARKEALSSVLESMIEVDEDRASKLIEKLAIAAVRVKSCPEAPTIPDIRVPIVIPVMPEIELSIPKPPIKGYPNVDIDDTELQKLVGDIYYLRKMECPTCHRKFVEEGHTC